MALKDEAQLESMFPDARLKDKEMFTHLNLEFDLQERRITTETAAKDYHGVPHYQYVFDTADKTAIEITNIDDEGIREAVVVVPAADNSVAVTADTSISSKDRDDAAAVAVPAPDLETAEKLSLEEQREVAFKVVAFFLMLIIASFAILYIYHRCSQSRVSSQREKKTL